MGERGLAVGGGAPDQRHGQRRHPRGRADDAVRRRLGRAPARAPARSRARPRRRRAAATRSARRWSTRAGSARRRGTGRAARGRGSRRPGAGSARAAAARSASPARRRRRRGPTQAKGWSKRCRSSRPRGVSCPVTTARSTSPARDEAHALARVRRDDLEAHRRLLVEKVPQHRRQERLAQVVADRHAERGRGMPGQLGELAERRLGPDPELAHDGQRRLARGAQAHAAAGALEELDAEVGLEPPDLLAHRRRGDVALPRRARTEPVRATARSVSRAGKSAALIMK